MKDRIGRYTLIRELGRGGMATVYLANDPNFGRNVAIKVLPRQFLHDPQFRTRFAREAQTIASLEHPSIVPVYDFGEQEEQPYIVMRYMQGGDLTHKLKGGALSVVDVAIIVNRLASALDSAHERNIIHRDLKPGNILFDRYDNAYLSDFGIVKLREQNATFTGNAIIGTPTYMSPEQAQGDKNIDGRSDLYALGVIIYEMLTGVVPYQGNTPVKQMMQHIMEPVPRILDVKKDLPPEIGRIVTRALAKEPDDRYPTSTALAEELNVAAGLGSAHHRLPPTAMPDAPSGTRLDNVAEEPPVNPQTMLDPSLTDDPPVSPHTMVDPAGTDDPSVGLYTIMGDATFDEDVPPPTNYTVYDDSELDDGLGPTVLGESEDYNTVIGESSGFTFVGEPDNFDDAFASFGVDDPDDVEDWLTPARTIQEPRRRMEPQIAEPDRLKPKPTPVPVTSEPDKKGLPLPWLIGGVVALIVIIGGIWLALRGDPNEVAVTPTVPLVESVTDVPPTLPPTDEPADEPTEVPVEQPTPESFVPTAGDFGGGGNLIAFQTQQGGGSWNIGVMNLDGSNRVILTDDSSNDQRPRWSPDGAWITFRSDRSGNEDVWMMRPDGSDVQQLTTNPLADHTGTFSPDGAQLVYHADFDGEGVASIALLPVEGGEPTRLTSLEDGNSFWASWSADGEQIAFWTLRNNDQAELYVMEADGSNQRPLVKSGGAYLDPIWSPVTDEIAYYAYGAAGRAEMFVISAETKQITPIETSLLADNILSDWSPDGEWLLLHSDFNGADDVYMVRKDGSEERRITNSATADQHPVWQPTKRVARSMTVTEPQPVNGELTVWHSFEGDQLAIMEQSFTELQKQNPGLVVSAEYIAGNEIRARYETASADGNAPDVLFAPLDWGGELLAGGLVQDPLSLLRNSDARRVSKTHLANVRVNHEAVGVPFLARGVILMRNRTLIPNPLVSFDDIVALDASRYDLERGLYYSGATLAAQSGQLMDADGNPTFNTEAGVAWLNTLKQFNDPHSYGDQDIDAFAQGQVGLVLDGTWNLGRLANAIGRENLVIDPWPSGMSGYVMYETVYVRAGLGQENRPIVTALLSNLLSPQLQSTLAQQGQVPVVEDATVTIDHIQQAQAVFATSEPLPISPAMSSYWEPLTNAINQVLDSNGDAAEVLGEASAEIESRLP